VNMLEKPPVASLKDEVKQKLRNAIISNELKPGERIIETEIAKNFGISQVPVREALRGLEEEGLVTSIKYKGAFVAEINQSEIFHMYSLRAEIEANVIGHILPSLTRRHFGELRDIVEQMKQYSDKPEDYAALSALDVEFHRTIIGWGQIAVYNRIWNMLNGHIRRFIAILHPTTILDGKAAYGTHLKLIEVMEERDTEKARAEFKDHIMWAFSKSRQTGGIRYEKSCMDKTGSDGNPGNGRTRNHGQ
jgi:DNA-binding GntR family transcriptional regulator